MNSPSRGVPYVVTDASVTTGSDTDCSGSEKSFLAVDEAKKRRVRLLSSPRCIPTKDDVPGYLECAPTPPRGHARLTPVTLVNNLGASMIATVFVVISTLSVPASVFNDGTGLTHFFNFGVSVTFFGCSVLWLVMLFFSPHWALGFGGEAFLVPFYVAMVSGIHNGFEGTGTDGAIFSTVVASMVITSVTLSVSLTVAGAIGLGKVVQFLPFPVVAGFLGGVGAMVVQSGLIISTDAGFHNLPLLFSSKGVIFLAVSLGQACFVTLLKKQLPEIVSIPVSVLGTTFFFHVICYASGTSFYEAQEYGWLLSTNSGLSVSESLGIFSFRAIRWDLMLQEVPRCIAGMVPMQLVKTYLAAAGCQLLLKRKLPLKRLIVLLGLGNLASAFVGSPHSTFGMIGTAIFFDADASHPIARLLLLFSCAVVAVFGVWSVVWIPKFVLGASMMQSGFGLMAKWTLANIGKMSNLELAVVFVMTFIAVVFGAPWNIMMSFLFGLISCTLLFLVSSARMYGLMHADEFTKFLDRSKVERSAYQWRVLESNRESMLVIRLKGSVFFASIPSFINEVVRHWEKATDEGRQLRFLIVSMPFVSSLDCSASFALNEMCEKAETMGTTVFFAGATSLVRSQVMKSGMPATIKWYADLDHALEFCEDTILTGVKAEHSDDHREVTAASTSADLGQSAIFEKNASRKGKKGHWSSDERLRAKFFTMINGLQEVVPGMDNLVLISDFVEPVWVDKGETVFRNDNDSSYLLAEGKLMHQITSPGGLEVRMNKVSSPTPSVCGIISMTLNQNSAIAIAAKKTLLFRMSRSSLESLERLNPGVAMSFHKAVVFLISSRLHQSQNEIAKVHGIIHTLQHGTTEVPSLPRSTSLVELETLTIQA